MKIAYYVYALDIDKETRFLGKDQDGLRLIYPFIDMPIHDPAMLITFESEKEICKFEEEYKEENGKEFMWLVFEKYPSAVNFRVVKIEIKDICFSTETSSYAR